MLVEISNMVTSLFNLQASNDNPLKAREYNDYVHGNRLSILNFLSNGNPFY